MRLLERVLVAVDFETMSQHVLETADRLGKAFGSELILLHVLPKLGDDLTYSVLAMAREGATQRLARFKGPLVKAGRTVRDPMVAEGIPFDQIIGVAEELDVNVILVGSHDAAADAEQGPQIGTTAERLCRKASKPVWIVRHDRPFAGRSILCPVDASSASRRALQNAIHLARKLQSQLNVLHVTEPVSTLSRLLQGESATESAQEEAQARRFNELIRQFDFTGLDWRKLARKGEAGDEILAACHETHADLIVMGTVGESGLARILLGSVAAEVARRSPCSLVMLKGEDAIRLKLEEDLTDVGTSYARGVDLLEHGFLEQAEQRFEHCVMANDFFIPGWLSLAEVYERRGDKDRAQGCRENAKRIEEVMYWRKVEADIRKERKLQERG